MERTVQRQSDSGTGHRRALSAGVNTGRIEAAPREFHG
jgi:hypothetical protein